MIAGLSKHPVENKTIVKINWQSVPKEHTLPKSSQNRLPFVNCSPWHSRRNHFISTGGYLTFKWFLEDPLMSTVDIFESLILFLGNSDFFLMFQSVYTSVFSLVGFTNLLHWNLLSFTKNVIPVFLWLWPSIFCYIAYTAIVSCCFSEYINWIEFMAANF